MDNLNEAAPIIKRVKKVHGGHHGGAWKVAYADFVTAMMALFIVLWILGQSADVKEAVAGYFKDPVGFSTKSKSLIDGKGQGPSLIGSGTQEIEEFVKKEVETKELQVVADQLEKQMEKDTDLKDLSDQVRIEMVNEGLRIELTDSANDIFFEVGTTELQPQARKLISKIGAELAKIPKKLIVEGHTDSRHFMNSGTGYTNWELSSERALAAKRALVVGGLKENQIDEIRGYADSKLRDPADPLSFVNRRISITVKYNTAK